MADIIDVSDLVLVYADGTKAVDDISFSVSEGEFFGFLGPNGAGKSTTIKVLTTLLRKTSGTVKVAGYDMERNPQEIRKLVGVEAQESVLDPDLTGRENMTLQGNLQQMRGPELTERVDELLKLVELEQVADKMAGRYSGGMKKRLQLASSLVHKPRLLFLDEPTTGLDPQSRVGIWKYLEKLNKLEGITIFLTTQYLEEADKLCGRLAIVDFGKIVASGSPAELKREVGADTINFSLEGGGQDGEAAKAKKILSSLEGVTEVFDSDGGLTAHAKDASRIIAIVVRALDEGGIRLSSLNVSTPSLDDVFLQHTGRRIRAEELGRMPDRRGAFGMRRRI
ncbi:MAG TPA: ATP-binding cassette domain-containing protein [Nitrososphaerales archaeon]|nr:ATP-binding cassette domain-containing protein [Nitrososphaerales archaeon]